MTADICEPDTKTAEHALLRQAKKAAPDALSKLLREANWQGLPLPVVEWIASRQGVCLSAALQCFFNADPMRFNYLHKREVPDEHRALCRALDTLCLRMNSGFYDNAAFRKSVAYPDRMANWLACQKLDVAACQAGRWVLREDALRANPVLRRASETFAELAKPQEFATPRKDWREGLAQTAKSTVTRSVKRRLDVLNSRLNQA